MTDCVIDPNGYRDKDGYGKRSVGNRSVRAHRAAWEAANGPLPEGAVLRHLCNTRDCINPEHLVPGTTAENNRDRANAGNYRLRPEDIPTVRGLLQVLPQKSVAHLFRVHPSTISLAARGLTWGDL